MFRQLTEEMERYRDLERTLKGEQEDWEERMALFEEKHAAEMEALHDDAEAKLDDKRAERDQYAFPEYSNMAQIFVQIIMTYRGAARRRTRSVRISPFPEYSNAVQSLSL